MNLNECIKKDTHRHSLFKGIGMTLLLFLLPFDGLIEKVAAQTHFSWEVGTHMGFTTNDREDIPHTVEFPAVGEIEKQSDLWGPGLHVAIRRNFMDSSLTGLIMLGYDRNRVRHSRTESIESLGISWQQHDVTVQAHYLTLGLGLEGKVYQWQSNALSLRLETAYLFNFINTLEWEKEYEKSLVDGRQTDRFYGRTNRFDRDTEDFEPNPFLKMSLQAAYEKDFGQNGLRVFVGLTILYQQVDSPTYTFDYYVNRLDFGAAFLF